MNKLFSVVICVSAMFFNLNANALSQQALTKTLIQQYAKATEDLTPLIEADSETKNKLADAMQQGKVEMLDVIKSLDLYPEIKLKVTSAGFYNIEQFVDASLRIMGAAISSQEQTTGMDIDKLFTMMEGQISTMQEQGIITKEMLDGFNGLKAMKSLKENASEADVRFMKENLDWVLKMIPNLDNIDG